MNDETRVLEKIAGLLELDTASLDVDASLFSLAPSSFRVVELVIELQEEFDVSFRQDDMHGVDTLGDLVRLVVSRRHSLASARR